MRVEGVPAFHHGTTRVLADGIVSEPLGFLREEIEPGKLLPRPPGGGLPKALERCEEVTFSFDGKLGDTLLAFGAVTAVLAYLTLVRPDQLPVVRTRGPHRALFDQVGVLEHFDVRSEPAPRASARTVVIGDSPGLSTSRYSAGRALFELDCDPEQPPCWSSGQFAYPFLPARYFLSTERQLGVRLSEPDGFMPTLAVSASASASTEKASSSGTLTVGVVTATSWPVRKDYGAGRFLEAVRALADDLGQSIHVVVASGKEDAPLQLPTATFADLTIDDLGDAHYLRVAEQLAACDLVVGNDTGLTHLAAAARRPDGGGPQIIGLYARHSHTKWRTGLAWHHALATSFSDRMHREDQCPVRDRIHDRQFGSAAAIGSIRAGALVGAAKTVLGREPGGDR